jgi:predicted TIM-barrel fold metal-dependent hydrolase
MQTRARQAWEGVLVDAHAHLGEGLFGQHLDAPSLLQSMDEAGVSWAVVSPLKPTSYHFGPENDRIAAAVAAHPDRLVGFARVDPWQGTAAVAEARRAFDLGLAGLFLHPFEEQFAANDERVHPLMALLEERGLPLVIAGGFPGFSHPSQIGDLARQFPQVTIIATHGGQLNISGLLLADAGRMLRANSNVLMETSGIYREDFIEDTVKELGAERVVFGSNAPYMDLGFEALRVRLAHLSDDEKELIGRANLLRLLKRDA